MTAHVRLQPRPHVPCALSNIVVGALALLFVAVLPVLHHIHAASAFISIIFGIIIIRKRRRRRLDDGSSRVVVVVVFFLFVVVFVVVIFFLFVFVVVVV
jgi:hypothetical protein